jgi:hypothetical protein
MTPNILQALLYLYGISHAELAHQVHSTPGYIDKIVSGCVTTDKSKTLHAVARRLKFPAQDLLTEVSVTHDSHKIIVTP